MVKVLASKFDTTVLHFETDNEKANPSVPQLLRNILLKPSQRRSIEVDDNKITFVGIRQPYFPDFNVITGFSKTEILLFNAFHPFIHIFYVCWSLLNFLLVNGGSSYDICIAEGPWSGIVAIILRRLGKISVTIYEDLDFYPDYLYVFFHSFAEYSILYQMEKMCLTLADMVITVSDSLARFRRKQGARKVLVIPNGVDFSLFENCCPKPENLTMIYVGALAEWTGEDLPIHAVSILRKEFPGIRYIIVGEGRTEELAKIADDLGVLDTHVTFVGRRNHNEIPELLSRASIGISLFKPSVLTKHACMLKNIEYMAAGLPFVTTDFGESRRMVKEHNCGELVDLDLNQLVSVVRNLITDRKLWHRHSINGKRAARKYDVNLLFAEEGKQIHSLLENHQLRSAGQL